jgi:membrane associated rhomboid family serine protease
MPPDAAVPIAIARVRGARAARELGLVLASAGIECEIEEADGGALVRVEPEVAERAARELQLYAEENRGWRRPEELPLALGESWIAVVSWFVLLLSTHAFSLYRAFGFDWWASGGGQAGSVQRGQLWRTVTALGLHVDALHLLGNLFFGSLFVALVVEMLGTGLGLFAVIGTGALANLANSWLNEPSFRSVGASTAVFAALGLLGGHRWQQRKLVRRLRRSSWIPLLAAAFLLAYLGSGARSELGAERIDVTGHLLGFGAGAVVGALQARLAPMSSTHARWQPAFAVAAFALWFGAWGFALQR